MSPELAIAAAAVVAGYVYSCWVFPFKRCGCCGGKGTHSKGKVFRDCAGWRCWPRSCHGSGRKRRLGRSLYVLARRLARDAS